MSDSNKMFYELALSLVPGIGGRQGRRLLQKCGSAEAVFKEKKHKLLKIGGIGLYLIRELNKREFFKKAEKEMKYINDNTIKTFFINHKSYPSKLRNCLDAPLMLYYKGADECFTKRAIGIVGTRRPTVYGREITEKIIDGLKSKDVLIVSGLAYGIDTQAHKSALKSDMDTIAVLAHGLDTIYPAQNRNLAIQIMEHGGLITEFPSGTRLNKDLFPRRNRIIAGLSDAILVVESGVKGGGMITARVASSYNRDIFAIPGSIKEQMAEGPHFLIKTNIAGLVESAEDIVYHMGWDDKRSGGEVQKQLFVDLNEDQQKVFSIINSKKEVLLDDITAELCLAPSKTNSLLLELEFKGLITLLPGGRYKSI